MRTAKTRFVRILTGVALSLATLGLGPLPGAEAAEVLVATYSNKNIYRFDASTGAALGQYTPGFIGNNAWGVLARPDGGFFATNYNTTANSIAAHNADGTVDTTWGSNGLASVDSTIGTSFANQNAYDATTGTLYFGGRINQAGDHPLYIGQVTSSGNAITGSVAGNGDTWSGAAINPTTGTVYAIAVTTAPNPVSRGVYVYDDGAPGNFTEFIPAADGVQSMVWDPTGTWLYARANKSYFRYDVNGNKDATWSITDNDIAPSYRSELAIGPDGYLWAADDGANGYIRRYDPITGNPVESKFIDMTGIGGARVADFAIVGVIPEPASLALLGIGGLMMLRRRR